MRDGCASRASLTASGGAALGRVCAGFAAPEVAMTGAVVLDAGDVPEPYASLLNHTGHMTERLRLHHGEPVDLEVLDHQSDGDAYTRRILLRLRGSRRVAEFGVVRMDLSCMPPDVREMIVERRVPLGDILIAHDVMRRIEPRFFYRFDGGAGLARGAAGMSWDGAYGRVGTIFVEDQPAIELLEVVPARGG